MISSIKSENVGLEQSTMTMKQMQQVDIYSINEIQKLEQEVTNLESKNSKLKEMLGNIGVQTDVQVSTVRNPTFEEVKTAS